MYPSRSILPLIALMLSGSLAYAGPGFGQRNPVLQLAPVVADDYYNNGTSNPLQVELGLEQA